MDGSSWAPHSFWLLLNYVIFFIPWECHTVCLDYVCPPSHLLSDLSLPPSLMPLSPSKITQGVPCALSLSSWVWSHLLELKENRLLLLQEQVGVRLYFRSRRMISNIHLTEELATGSKSLSFVQLSCFPQLDSSFHHSKPCHSVSKSSPALSVPPPCTVIILS